jgi:peptidoglycan/LPS O-acetylase OafA/YrhL
VIFFAPATAFAGAALTLLHVSREGFLFVSACMLTYAYYRLERTDLRRFWKRRLVTVGLPYACWTVVYFAIELPSLHGSALADAGHLGVLLLTGYSQLYFLVVLLQFYVVFPAVLWLLRRTEGHHATLLLVSLSLQVAYTALPMFHPLGPLFSGATQTREVVSYQLYLMAGCLAAVHYDAVHRWILGHPLQIIGAALVTGGFAEACYFIGRAYGVPMLSGVSGAFSPFVIPFNISAIALIYLAGVALVRSRKGTALRRIAKFGSNNSYAVYLSQVMCLDLLATLGWKHLDSVIPWPLVILGSVLIVFASGCLLGEVLSRTPLSTAFAGRHRAERRHPRTGSEPTLLLEGDLAA